MSKRCDKLIPFENLFFSQTANYLDNFLVKQAGKSLHTKKQYRIGLSEFYDYIVDIRHFSPESFCFSDISYNLILEYSQYLQREKKLGPSTVNVRLSCIREYLKYTSDGNAALTQYFLIAKRIPMLTIPKKRRPVIQRNDLAVLLDSPNDSRVGNRDRFIMILLYDSAIRVEELVKITLGDITVDKNKVSIVIHGKGRKERSITLSSNCSRHAVEYLQSYHKEPWAPNMPLIYTVVHDSTHPMSVRNVERIMKKYGDITRKTNSSTPEKVHPHMMRRTRATNLYQDGVPISDIAALLGHAQMETTRTSYAFSSDEQMQAMMETAVGNEEPDLKKEWLGKVDDVKRRFGLK